LRARRDRLHVVRVRERQPRDRVRGGTREAERGAARRTRPARRHDGGGAPGDIRCVLHTGPHTTALAW
jgi:hypothetical protein